MHPIPKYLLGQSAPGDPRWIIRSRHPFLIAHVSPWGDSLILNIYPEAVLETEAPERLDRLIGRMLESEESREVFEIADGISPTWCRSALDLPLPQYLLCRNTRSNFTAVLACDEEHPSWLIKDTTNEAIWRFQWAKEAPRQDSEIIRATIEEDSWRWLNETFLKR